MASDLPLPSKPIITRWLTWLNASFYYAENFEAIKTIIEKMNSKDAIYTRGIEELVNFD